ncbi:MAG: NTP transferase domain-containing protein [Myxococcota bacterium]
MSENRSRVAVAAVVLAAGRSSRMGRAKALLPVRGRPVVAWHVAALRGIAAPVVVVVGAEPAIAADGAIVVENAAWARTGMAESAAVGLAAVWPGAVPDGVRAVVTPVDTIPASGACLARLLGAGGAAVPVTPDGRDGHPVVLDAGGIRAVRAGSTLRAVLTGAARVAGDPWSADDFDDEAAFAAALQRWPE